MKPPPHNVGAKADNSFKVSQAEAQSFAVNYVQSVFADAHVSVKNVRTLSTPVQNKTVYTVSLSPAGFILLSDDKRDAPVLAYSLENSFEADSFDELPPNIAGYLAGELNAMVKFESKPDVSQKLDYIHEWETFLSDGVVAGKIPLPDSDDCDVYYDHAVDVYYDDARMTTRWGQKDPYNLYCPTGCGPNGNQHKLTGCIATAMAQILKFWSYPPNRYNWSILEDDYYDGDRSASALEVARLMRDCGNAVNMDYGCRGSGSYLSDVEDALPDDFNFNDELEIIDYDYHDASQELSFGRPIILVGSNPQRDKSHAWVTDAEHLHYIVYKRVCDYIYPVVEYLKKYHKAYLHMNWGWNGIFNGYYLAMVEDSNDLEYDVLPYSMGSINQTSFFEDMEMLYKIHP